MWEPITGGKRAYAWCGSQSQEGREHMLDVGANHRREESIFFMWEPWQGAILLGCPARQNSDTIVTLGCRVRRNSDTIVTLGLTPGSSSAGQAFTWSSLGVYETLKPILEAKGKAEDYLIKNAGSMEVIHRRFDPVWIPQVLQVGRPKGFKTSRAWSNQGSQWGWRGVGHPRRNIPAASTATPPWRQVTLHHPHQLAPKDHPERVAPAQRKLGPDGKGPPGVRFCKIFRKSPNLWHLFGDFWTRRVWHYSLFDGAPMNLHPEHLYGQVLTDKSPCITSTNLLQRTIPSADFIIALIVT
eukprot:8562615-Pyramimonas_sp.AAC.2